MSQAVRPPPLTTTKSIVAQTSIFLLFLFLKVQFFLEMFRAHCCAPIHPSACPHAPSFWGGPRAGFPTDLPEVDCRATPRSSHRLSNKILFTKSFSLIPELGRDEERVGGLEETENKPRSPEPTTWPRSPEGTQGWRPSSWLESCMGARTAVRLESPEPREGSWVTQLGSVQSQTAASRAVVSNQPG